MLQRRPRTLYSAFDRFPSQKGAGVHIARFAKALFDARGGGLLYVLGGDGLPVHQVEEDVEIVRFSTSFPNYLERAQAFTDRLTALLDDAESSLEIAHFRDPWSGLAITSRSPSYATVFEVNGLPSIELPTAYPSAAPSTLAKIKRVEQFVLEKADAIVTPAATIRNHLVDRGIDANKIQVIPNGADVRPLRTDATSLIAESQHSEAEEDRVIRQQPYLLYFGSLHPWQGVETLIRAFARVRDLNPLRLVLCCSQESRQARAYARLAEKLEIEGSRVIWRFELSAEELAPWVDGALICVAPLTECARNIIQGCSPLKILEAMAAGVAVVASDLPAVRELMTDQIEGLLIPPDRPADLARAIRVLYEVPELRCRLGRCGRERVESSLTWQHSLAKLSDLYARFGLPQESALAQERVQ